jgi:hypothetical protein
VLGADPSAAAAQIRQMCSVQLRSAPTAQDWPEPARPAVAVGNKELSEYRRPSCQRMRYEWQRFAGRLKAAKAADGSWRSSKAWVDEYRATRYKPS